MRRARRWAEGSSTKTGVIFRVVLVVVVFLPFALVTWVTGSSTKIETALRAGLAVIILCGLAYSFLFLPLLSLTGYPWATSEVVRLSGSLVGLVASVVPWRFVVEPRLGRKIPKTLLTLSTLSVAGCLIWTFAWPDLSPVSDTFSGRIFLGFFGGLCMISAELLARLYRPQKGRRRESNAR